MRFGPVAVAAAEGAILAHSLRLDGRQKIAKGTRLTADHIADLQHAGVDEVVVARLEPGDVDEDTAAARLAAAILAHGDNGLAVTRATTGRVNLKALGPGVAEIDAPAVDAINRIDPAITLATVPRWQRMGPGGLVATIKIIPYAVPEAQLATAVAVAPGAVSLRPPVVQDVTLIETVLGNADEVPDKGRRAVARRLAHFGAQLTARVVVPHRAEAMAAALRAAPGELILILTGSATSDIADDAPEALRRAGGTVLRYGMPVDPGNLLFLGRLGETPVIGLPGCARSPALNGADWVLERIICGVPPAQIDIAGMGVGGLLKEIPSRPQPRDGTD